MTRATPRPITETALTIALATTLAGVSPHRMRRAILGPIPRLRSSIVDGRRLVDLADLIQVSCRADWRRP